MNPDQPNIFKNDEERLNTENSIINKEYQISLIHDLIDAEFQKTYPSNRLYPIFILNFFSSILVNVDHGSIPGCSLELE